MPKRNTPFPNTKIEEKTILINMVRFFIFVIKWLDFFIFVIIWLDDVKRFCYFPADVDGGGEALPEADGGALQVFASADSYS